jgi:hypothetical protein
MAVVDGSYSFEFRVVLSAAVLPLHRLVIHEVCVPFSGL